MKLKHSFFIIFLFLIFTNLVAQNSHKPDFLPISVWYSGGKARAPMLSPITKNSEHEWLRDLQQIKSLGFNTVRTWVEWAFCEPKPGQYNFENLKLLCGLAQQVGLKVFIQMYVDSAPDWVGEKFPEGRFETQSGDKVTSQVAPGYCTDHPGVREAVLNFYTETAKAANQFSNLFGWDLWSEPHIVNWAYINYVPNVQFCFCPNTKNRFQEWLKTKYKTVSNLNQSWYRNFENFADAEPPRFGTILSYTDFIDWKNFIYQKLAQDLKMRYQAIRKVDKTHVITSHAAVPSIFYTPYNGYGATDDFLMAQSVDYYGTSLYPKHNHPDRHWENWKFQVAADFSRSANKSNNGFYVGELQAGRGTIGLNIGDPITEGDHKIWIWSAIAKGAKAVNIYAYYPMSSGYESGGYGLINLNGSVTTKAKNAGNIARLIDQNQKLFLNSKPIQATIALVYNPLAQLVGGEQHHSTGDNHFNSLIGYYRFFTENNIPVDFIHRKDLETGDVSQYQLIIVPYPLMFTENAALGLKSFIKEGGFVVAEARLAWNDERGFATPIIPGLGLDEVFGAQEKNIKMQSEVTMFIKNNSHPVMKGFGVGQVLKGSYFAESIDPKKAQVLAIFDDQSPAMVTSQFGEGECLWIGSFLGLANHPKSDSANNMFLQNLLEWAKIEKPFYSSHDGKPDNAVEIKLQENETGYVLFLINHGKKIEDVAVYLQVESSQTFNIQPIGTNENMKKIAEEGKLTINSTLNARDVNVLILKKI